MRPAVIITSRAGRTGTAVLGAGALALVVWDATRVGLWPALINLPFVALFVWCAWLFWGLASISIDDHGVQVVNQLRIWNVPWNRLDAVTGRWGVTLTTSPEPSDTAGSDAEAGNGTGTGRGRTIRAWAAPAKGTAGKVLGGNREMPMIPEQGTEPVRTSLDAFSAARLIEIEQIQRSPTDAGQGDPVRVRVNWLTIVITAGLILLALLT
ncbi:MAG: hypothetical protein LKI24_04345 [Acidipropionibacterium sp.]|jgi:hypothetical protein|nr:hypothetical protein [Acidipropionibacterium sp.]